MQVLIVGAGIAGEAAAVLLGRAGWDVTVVELATGPRTGGQTVDLRGGSREVLDRAGLLDECLALTVPQRGIAWVDADGRRRGQMPVEAFGGHGFVSTEELLRSDLARVLHDAAAERATHVFGDTVDALSAGPDGVAVTFRHRASATFDLVIGADGTHSQVRSLAFGPEQLFRRPLGLAHAWFTLTEKPDTPELRGWFLVHNAPGSLVVGARPGRPGAQEIGFSFPADTVPVRRDRDARLALLRKAFVGQGWRVPELLDAAGRAPDFALDTFDQIRLARWHTGRVVLLGDSAWCASPLSGLGTALALLGAQALADELIHRPTDSDAALDRYETAMRPRVRSAQRMFPGRVRSFAPRTGVGIGTVIGLTALAQTRPLQPILTRVAS